MGEGGGGAGVLKSPKNTPKIPNLKLFDLSNPKSQRSKVQFLICVLYVILILTNNSK